MSTGFDLSGFIAFCGFLNKLGQNRPVFLYTKIELYMAMYKKSTGIAKALDK